MKINAYHSTIKYVPKHDEFLLNETDFHPCNPFFIDHPHLNPERVGFIQTKGILETTKYIRHTLKVFDWLLSVNGILNIAFYKVSFDAGGYPLRIQAYLMNEISLCFRERFMITKMETTGNILTISLTKIKSSLPEEDCIGRWSFGIVSDGRKNDRILNIISQIQQFNIPQYEILICGPSPSDALPEQVKVLDDSDLYTDCRIPISKKKNRIIAHALYNNLIIMHDRISFHEQWYKKMQQYGNYFDQVCMRIVNEENPEQRVQDWSEAPADITLFRKAIPKTLSYNQWSKHIYVNGGLMLIKKHIIKEVMLNPLLNWGEMEDVDLSERLYSYGLSLSFFKDNLAYSQTLRLPGWRKPNFLKYRIYLLKAKIGVFRRDVKIRRKFKNYLSDIAE